MIYLIIFLAVAMVLAPLMAFKPSKQVKRQMAFREQALALGLQIKVVDLPQSHRAKVRKEDVEHGVVYRFPLRVKQSLTAVQQQVCVATEQGFEWSSGSQVFVKNLFEQNWPHLPEDAVAMELGPTALGLYWREQGAPEQVQEVYQLLSELGKQVINHYGVSDAGT